MWSTTSSTVSDRPSSVVAWANCESRSGRSGSARRSRTSPVSSSCRVRRARSPRANGVPGMSCRIGDTDARIIATNESLTTSACGPRSRPTNTWVAMSRVSRLVIR